MRVCGCSLFLAVTLFVFANPVQAGPVTVDGVVFAADASNPGAFSASASMSWDNATNTLTIQLANTSTGLQDKTADNLLTGLGFALPDGAEILSGSVMMSSVDQAVGFDPVMGTDISSEWGFDNQPLDSGAFQDPLLNSNRDLNTVVSSMVSQTTDRFALGSLGPPVGLNGPDFGLLSTDAGAYPVNPGRLSGGVEAVWGGVTITLQLSDLDMTEAELLAFIEAHDVVASFGSPKVSVPEPGTLALLAFGLLTLGIFGRRSRKLA